MGPVLQQQNSICQFQLVGQRSHLVFVFLKETRQSDQYGARVLALQTIFISPMEGSDDISEGAIVELSQS